MTNQPDGYFAALYHELEKARQSKASAQNWQSRRVELLRELPQLLGGFPERSADLRPVLLESVHADSYTRELVEFTTAEHLRATAYILLPDHPVATAPAIVALHGHGDGHKDIVGLRPDGTEQQEQPGIHKHFARELARKGFIVIAPELLGFGERRWKNRSYAGDERNSCYSMAVQLLLCGKTLAGLRVYETIRAVDLLLERTAAQPGRIGCVGFSGGGMIAALVSALDDRIKAAVISGYANTFKGSIMSVRHCLDNYIPGILGLAEMPDIIGLIAPRPLFLEAGETDHIFPVEHVRQAYERLQQIYRTCNAEQCVELHVFPGKHEFSGDRSLNWLAQRMLNL